MGNASDAGRSQGDVMYRLQELEREVRDLQTARRLESASIGSGGLRVQGGRILAENTAGARIFEVRSDPPEIFLEESLVAALARDIVAETYTAANVAALQGTTSTTPADLATVGPVVDATVGQAGRMVITLSADIRPPQATTAPGAVTTGAIMGFDLAGPSAASPAQSLGLAIFHRDDFGAGGEGSSDSITASRVVLLTNLNPGAYTVTAKYWRTGVTAGVGPAEFGGRVVAVQAF